MTQNPAEASSNPIWQITIALVRMVQGEEAAIQKKNELMMPEKVRRSGILFLIAGGVFLLAACLQFVGLVMKMIGV
jgi:hypothetical protein